jgi:hypothetical protein
VKHPGPAYVIQTYYADEIGWDDLTASPDYAVALVRYDQACREETCEVRLIRRELQGQEVFIMGDM